MKSLALAIFATTLASNLLFSQTHLNSPEKPFIEVNGKAEKEIIPDEIYIRIIIREKTENRDNTTVEEQETKLKEALKALGVDLTKLSLTDANADYMRVGWGKREVVEKKDYTLMVSDATMVGKVFKKLDELEIREAYIARVDHSKIEEFRKEMKIKAIQAAKEKANYLVTAIDEKLGSPQIIRENTFSTLQNYNYKLNETRKIDAVSNKSYGYADMLDKNADVIQFQKITVSSSIYVKFKIGD